MTIWLNLLGIIAIGCGIWFKYPGMTITGCAISLGLSLPIVYRSLRPKIPKSLSLNQKSYLVIAISMSIVVISLLKIGGFFTYISGLSARTDWSAVGALGLWGGALGQTMIATLAAFVSWRQYIVSRDLTIEQNRLNRQQNIITQQQTIDNYFQGICDLVLDDDGFLEDWPQERAFAVGRTGALLSSINAEGKARVLRFLSRSQLLTPLQRDSWLGKVILNGDGGYDEDRIHGTRVIDLGAMLVAADLVDTDLRWTDLSDANLIRANLTKCRLFKANLARTILYRANLKGADLAGTRFFYGNLKTASPRALVGVASPLENRSPDYITGEYTGAVVEDVDFTGVRRMSEEQRSYCCAWCGESSRLTIPGGCQGIPNRLLANDYSAANRAFEED